MATAATNKKRKHEDAEDTDVRDHWGVRIATVAEWKRSVASARDVNTSSSWAELWGVPWS